MCCTWLAASTGRKNRQKSLSVHHRITLSSYIFATKARIDNRKKNLLNSNISLTCPHNMVNLGVTNGWDPLTSLGHPSKFQLVLRMAALLHGTPVVGVSQTLRHWTEGATYIRQGGHHIGQWLTFLVLVALWNGADYYIFILWFLLSFFLPFFFFSSPNLSRHRLDIYHTSTHGEALVRIYNADLKRAACVSLKIQDAKKSPKIAIWAPSHNFLGSYLRN